ncbi:MAG TPA: hypothetical protein P5341_16165 [Hyphomonas sp.]|nr:hypothetical protein [Hyphomonas sp.]
MEKLFPRIETLADVMRLARGGGIAGLIFVALILLDGLLTVVSGGGGQFSGPHAMPLIGTGLEIAAILILTWRVWSGKAWASAILMMALFVMKAMTEIPGGLYGAAWIVAYFSAGLMMLNAIRASLRYRAVTEATLAVPAW